MRTHTYVGVLARAPIHAHIQTYTHKYTPTHTYTHIIEKPTLKLLITFFKGNISIS